jgi:hypothetical protein
VHRSTDQPRSADGPEPASVPAPSRLSRRQLCRGGLVAVGLGATVPLSALLGGCSGDSSSDEEGANQADGSGDDTGAATPTGPVMYASPTCGCCSQYATYLRDNGHEIDVQHVDDLAEIKSRHGIPPEAESCHTTLLDDYVVEGHVPVEAIDKLLTERPQIDGIALPEMPAGSPGMPGPNTTPFQILAITDNTTSPYLTL